MGVAEQALEAQHEHLKRAIDLQLERAIERLDIQVGQRVEMAEMAIEGMLLEAEELETEVDPAALLTAMENATGLRLKMDEESRERIREDPHGFRRNVPPLIEGGLGLRVWAGLIQSVERRVGESLGIDFQLTIPVDWDAASEALQEAMDKVWARRTTLVAEDIERDLAKALSRADRVSEALILRLLVRMSYGQQAYFDRKTHQRRSVAVARLSYPYVAARYLEGENAQKLKDRVITHLEGAIDTLQHSLGLAEVTRLAHARVSELDEETQQILGRVLDEEVFDDAGAQPAISTLPEGVQSEIALALGSRMLSQSHRNLILSVSDRLWVDYLTQMEALRTSIGLEAYAQRDPLVQYKSRAFDMFGTLLSAVRSGVVSRLFRTQAPSSIAQATQARPARPQTPPDGGQTPSPKKRKKRRRRRRR
ncbi:MAG: hypothetical protein GTO14_23755 [Anaerolineales bacterium]|nr:hypothetical protein [Anaerolineales bacterium]